MAAMLSFATSILASEPQIVNVYNSQEISESDGMPVLVKHLPDYENVRTRANFAKNLADLKKVLGDRPLLDQIDFAPGTEAVTAQYAAGRLLIVEFTSPQGSVDADEKIKGAIGDDPAIVYRRIGNYNALVFDATDQAAANALLDQVKYEKRIQWLGENPFNRIRERNFINTTTDVFISTVEIIFIGIGISLVGGLIAGYLYFMWRERKRGEIHTYTDAGGMTRLNLDGFTPDIMPDRLLGE